MKKHLIPESGQFYKANLHCHTTVSDGCRTPEEIKQIYRANGYSVVAYTDHNVLISHNDLRSEDFLPLNGIEVDVDEAGDKHWRKIKRCHLCFIALEPNNLTMPFFHRSKYIFGNAEKYRAELHYDESQPDYEREYSHAGISDMMLRARNAGFFVTYNHPTWSREEYPDYTGYRGMHAMELINYGCGRVGFQEYNIRIYDDILRTGKKIFAVGTDDNHHPEDECGSWVMIKADRLDYRTITQALENGHFYTSTGPEIHSVWVEDGQIHVTCSKASHILANYGSFRAHAAHGDGLTYATFPLEMLDDYFRITVIDDKGRCADTNAYFTDDLLKL